jgi:hypothetical protein
VPAEPWRLYRTLIFWAAAKERSIKITCLDQALGAW